MPEYFKKPQCRRVMAAVLIIAPMIIATGCDRRPSTPPKPKVTDLPAMPVRNLMPNLDYFAKSGAGLVVQRNVQQKLPRQVA